jgi:hypothetical protein
MESMMGKDMDRTSEGIGFTPILFFARLAWVFLMLRGIRECSNTTAAL